MVGKVGGGQGSCYGSEGYSAEYFNVTYTDRTVHCICMYLISVDPLKESDSDVIAFFTNLLNNLQISYDIQLRNYVHIY
jgi:hypothetical protein